MWPTVFFVCDICFVVGSPPSLVMYPDSSHSAKMYKCHNMLENCIIVLLIRCLSLAQRTKAKHPVADAIRDTCLCDVIILSVNDLL